MHPARPFAASVCCRSTLGEQPVLPLLLPDDDRYTQFDGGQTTTRSLRFTVPVESVAVEPGSQKGVEAADRSALATQGGYALPRGSSTNSGAAGAVISERRGFLDAVVVVLSEAMGATVVLPETIVSSTSEQTSPSTQDKPSGQSCFPSGQTGCTTTLRDIVTVLPALFVTENVSV